MKIAIIGAGAAGLAALRHSLEEGHNCTVFEQTNQTGGTWNYTDLTGTDENGLPVHTSMYQGLKSNLPKELMEYQDYHYKEKGRSFLEQGDVVEYMNDFANQFNLIPHIKFFRYVSKVHPISNGKWWITERNTQTNEINEHEFDAVMVCVGNYSVPKLPKIPGTDTFSGGIAHSHFYRKSDRYNEKRVLIIGAGPSGADIARILSCVAKTVYLSSKGSIFWRCPKSVIQKPLVSSFTHDKAIFTDGSQEEIDEIIYCTGYQYSYPFLTEKCGIKIENNWVKHVYKHIVNVEHPTMGFIGIVRRVCSVPTFDIQVKFFLAFLKGQIKKDKEDMLQDVLRDMERRKKLGLPEHHAHMTFLEQGAYFDDLSDTANITKIKPVIQKLFECVAKDKNNTKRYKIINDEEFLELSLPIKH